MRRYAAPGVSCDPFAVNPIRRSALAIAVAGFTLFGGTRVFGPGIGTTLLYTCGWLAATVLIFSIPVLIVSVCAELWTLLRRRTHPSISQLDLSPRVLHLLERHGYTVIDEVDHAPDGALLLLSNFDARALREVRRAVSLWKYRRWQDAGFPARGY
ncbi:MAG TPA: DNA-directed RNA polymerase subunit alpha C-terminal domain-containing protein [Thermomicrobiaceae bacterium]|nr:DNA-directed RNA polymerase subunit alpha C-terminal domain-containing protein [Thermomicrobiaceae bacterium]